MLAHLLCVLTLYVNLLQILTKDSVTVSVDAVCYFRIQNPILSVTAVSDAHMSTRLLAQTTLRNLLGVRYVSCNNNK